MTKLEYCAKPYKRKWSPFVLREDYRLFILFFFFFFALCLIVDFFFFCILEFSCFSYERIYNLIYLQKILFSISFLKIGVDNKIKLNVMDTLFVNGPF